MFKKISYLIDYFKCLKNPISALQFKFGLKKHCQIKPKNCNQTFILYNVFALDSFMIFAPVISKEKISDLIDYVKAIDQGKELINLGGIKYFNLYNEDFKKTHPQEYHVSYGEYFSEDQLDMIDFNKRDVIDIGANIGDTALYFAQNGANVISFEPVKHLYELGLETLKLNPNFENNIQFFNKAVGGKHGKLNIENSSAEAYINEGDSYEVDVITVTDILNDYNFNPDILKMDCEGCEFEIILNEDLSMFNDIVFEHHSELTGKNYRLLTKRLKEQNFKINCYPIKWNTSKSFEEVGIIHAFK